MRQPQSVAAIRVSQVFGHSAPLKLRCNLTGLKPAIPYCCYPQPLQAFSCQVSNKITGCNDIPHNILFANSPNPNPKTLPFISDIKQNIEFTYFDIREYEKPLRNDDKKDDLGFDM